MQKSQAGSSENVPSESNSRNDALGEGCTRIHAEQHRQPEAAWKDNKSESPDAKAADSDKKPKKLIDYTKSRARGAVYDARDWIDALDNLQKNERAVEGTKRRNLFRSNTASDLTVASSKTTGEEEMIDFFLKVPTRSSGRRRSDPTNPSGRIHQSPVMQELRDSFHRRKSSMRRRSNLSPRSGQGQSKSANASPASSMNLDMDDEDDDRDAIFKILNRVRSDGDLQVSQLPSLRRQSSDSLELSSHSRRRRSRSSIIKRSIESLARQNSTP